MTEDGIEIGLVVECRRLGGTWGGVAWSPVAVFETPPDVAPWTEIARGTESARYYAGAQRLTFYSSDTAGYLDNLGSGTPKLWVVLRCEDLDAPPIEVLTVTADPSEGEGAAEVTTNVVETITMPDGIAALLARFVERHHVERPIIKRKRDRRGPDVLARGAPPVMRGGSGRREE